MAIRARTIMTERYRTRLAAQRSQNVGKRCKLAFRRHHDHARVVHHARDQTDFIHAVLGLSRHRDEIIAGHVDHADRVSIRRGAGNRGKRDLSTGARLVQHNKFDLSAQSLLDERQQLACHDVGSAARSKPDDHFDRLVVRPSRPGWSASCESDYCCNQRDDLTMHDIPPLFLLLGGRPAAGQRDRRFTRIACICSAWRRTANSKHSRMSEVGAHSRDPLAHAGNLLSIYRRRRGLGFGGSVPVIARYHAASDCASALSAARFDCAR